MTTQRIQDLRKRVAAAQEALDRELAGLNEAQFHKTPREGEWSPADIVAHICESPTLTMTHVLRIATEDNPTVGRTPADVEARLRVLAEHANDSLAVALAALAQANAQVLKGVASLSDEQLDRQGQHTSWGVVTTESVLDRLISHYEDHARQIASCLEG
ncbi:MAG: DinB family protein [Chloroflexi bacterium]|nr:DinB family protein [Chloroflexota bacterium]